MQNLMTTPFRGTKSQDGMTLIEIIIVLALVGGLMAMVASSVTAAAKTAKIKETELAFRQLSSTLLMYKTSTGKMPTTEQGLKALIENPGVASWHGPYCEPEGIKDAWGNDIHYEYDGKKAHFVSAGDDEKFGTDDDVAWPTDEKKPAD